MTKSFELRIDEDLHKEVKDAAHDSRISMNTYILDAIREKLARETK